MSGDVRYVWVNVTVQSGASTTVRQQGLFVKRGWRKWLAFVLRKPVSEWRDLDCAAVPSTPCGDAT